MGLPVDVPGLNTIVPDIPDGRLVIVESGPDPAKSFFVRRLVVTAIRTRRSITFVTSRDKEELDDLLMAEGAVPDWREDSVRIVPRDSIVSLDEYGSDQGLLAVDSFSFLTLDLAPVRLSDLLRSLRAACRGKQMTAILATDRGMFEARAEAVAIHLADGVVQFHAKEAAEGMVRFLRIPKWMDGRFVDRNIHYDFDGKRMVIDLRRRVL